MVAWKRGVWSVAIVGMMLLGVAATLASGGAIAQPQGSSSPSVALAAPAGSPSATVEPTPATAGASGPSLPSGLVPRLAYSGPTPAHLPAAWGPDAMPPGAPVPSVPSSGPSASSPQQGSGGTSYPSGHGVCVGKWPSGGQSFYSNGCIGHDEPAINPYSDLPGSGGNVSWNVSLPVDGGPSHNQSDIYIAIWFGMNLYDPYGYNGQCFLELQMYPDTNGAGEVQVGAWSAFAVAWQIQLSNGYEDPCFAAPLNEPNGTPLQMNEGDHLYVNMTGWEGSPHGEKISVIDTTSGVTSHLRLYNYQQHYPLNPAYLENNVQDALPWSPGGDLPVSFAFESGHTTDDPENDTFGGCNSGLPPPNPLNGAVPCGSYNPKDWATDTKVPWHFYPVVFFNSAERQTAAQYGFEQDFGASAWIDGLSYGNCTGRDGSAYCSYPWYSFDASLNAFEFGATDYSGTTQDFGTYAEYASSLQTDSSGLNFYPVENFSIPTTAGSSLHVGVSGSGTVFFLNDSLSASTSFHHLADGAYSINAVPAPGQYFEGYTTSSSVALDAAGPAWNSLQLSGSGSLTAHFGATPPPATSVTFRDMGGHGFVTVVPGFAFQLNALYPPAGPGFGLAPVFHSTATNVAPGRTLSLVPGIYSVQANPAPGFNFTGWTWSSGVYVFAPATNYTWINVTSIGGTLEAHYEATPLTATVWLATDPAQGGTIQFGPFTFGSGAVFTADQGTYAVQALPAPGYRFVTWAPGFMSTMSNFSASSYALVQYGPDYLTAVFSSVAVLHQGGNSAKGGFAIDGHAVHGSVHLPQVGNLDYQLEAVANPGSTFAYWTVGNGGAAWIANLTDSITSILVNGSTTVTPHFVASPATDSVRFVAHGGTIHFDAVDSLSGSRTVSVSPGTYLIAETPAAGRTFEGWSTSGSVHVGTAYALSINTLADVENFAGTWTAWYNVTIGGSGTITARFTDVTHPVTFIDFPYDPHLSVTLSSGSTTLVIHAGTTIHLPSGTYTLRLTGGSIARVHWYANSNLTFAPDRGATTTLTVTGSGTIYAVAEPSPAPASLRAATSHVAAGVMTGGPSSAAPVGVGRWN
ncbi:MAG: hypothetical protein WB789_06450 [Thermoplasmata archaeon]